MENGFGEFLKEKRVEKNLTQKELATFLFVSESAVSKWEKDVARPDITLLPKLSELLGVSEHEIITASVDKQARAEKIQAKRWRVLSTVWHLFFLASYIVAAAVCFICNIAVNRTLSWFWIVIAALILAFSFTNLPGLIKKNRIIFIPLSMYAALCLLLAVCAVYTRGDWFFVAAFSVLFGLTLIFTPIYIARLEIFKKIRKYNDFATAAICFVMLNILLIIIFLHSLAAGNAEKPWYFTLGLPISFVVYLILNLFLAVRFLKTNRFIKTATILSMLIFFVYLIPPFIKVKSQELQTEIDSLNVFCADFSNWQLDITIEQNINCIIFLTLLFFAAIFFIVGVILHHKNKTIGEKHE